MEVTAPESFKRTLSNLLRARFPYIYMATWEEERALATIRSIAGDRELIKTTRKVYTWSVTKGLVGEGQTNDEATKSPLKALAKIQACDHPALFILKDFHVYFGGNHRQPDHTIVRKIRDMLTELKQSPNPKNVIFISPYLQLPADLEKTITILDFDLPSFAEIKYVLDGMIEANRLSGRIEIDLQPQDEERIAKAALGLTLHEAENAFARAMVEDGRLCKDDVDVVLEEKRQMIKKSEILEFIKSDLNMNDVGGLDNLKRWLVKRNQSWLEAAQRYNLPAPKGVLITGVPGCGKSLIAKAVSAMWHLPLLRLDIGKIFSGIVGSSEENMRRAIQTAEAISPSVLWIDEIEKGFSGLSSSGDSGTSSRIFGTFLTWMQEKSKAVFVVATANQIQSLPPEMLRKGRFDEIFFVDLPTFNERKQIFKVHIHKRLKDPQVISGLQIDDELFTELSHLTEGYVGAELEQIVISALFEAFSENRPIRRTDFKKAIEQTVPLSVTQAEQIHAIREWANLRAVAATLSEERKAYNYSDTGDANAGQDDPDQLKYSRGGRAVDF